LYRSLAEVGLTLLEGGNNVASRCSDLEDRRRFMIVCSKLTALMLVSDPSGEEEIISRLVEAFRVL